MFIIRQGFKFKNRKLDGVLRSRPILLGGKMPRKVLEDRSKTMDNFSGENAEAQRVVLVSMVVNLPAKSCLVHGGWLGAPLCL
jgi:hypothetical protein